MPKTFIHRLRSGRFWQPKKSRREILPDADLRGAL
jgi:hypothetical protein